jgi:small GTP-binding protein
MTAPRPVKIVLVGDSSVGKTTIVNNFAGNSDEHTTPTVNTGYVGIDVTVDGVSHAFDLWDTAGQEQYNALIPKYCRGASGALICYDVTTLSSFEHLSRWLEVVRESAEPFVLVFGNKTDLKDERVVQSEQAEQFCARQGCEYIEGSARSGFGMEAALQILAKGALEVAHRRKEPSRLENGPVARTEESKSGCC